MKSTVKELRQKPLNELQLMLKENREKLRSLRFDLAANKLKNTHQLKAVKRQVAQILTIFKEKK